MKKFKIAVVMLAALMLVVLNMPENAFSQEVRKSLMASSWQRIGVDTDITIVYSRPGVKGRQIWGELVPMGMTKTKEGNEVPWRAGANENTTFEASKDVMINGKKLPAGKYGLYMVPGEKEWMIIFSKTNDAWGSYSYKQSNDALRITASAESAPHQEWLLFGFEDLKGTSATAFLHWEKVKVPFTVSVAG